MQVTSFDKPTCRAISEAAAAALQEVAKKFGVSIERGGGTFEEGKYTMRFHVAIGGDAGEAIARKNFAACCKMYQLDPEDFGRVFTVKGVEYKVTGINMKSHKFPIAVQILKTGQAGGFAASVARHLHPDTYVKPDWE